MNKEFGEPPPPPEFTGFKTARGQEIHVSLEVVKKQANILNDVTVVTRTELMQMDKWLGDSSGNPSTRNQKVETLIKPHSSRTTPVNDGSIVRKLETLQVSEPIRSAYRVPMSLKIRYSLKRRQFNHSQCRHVIMYGINCSVI